MSLVVGVDPSLTSAGVAILKDGQPVHVSHHGLSGHDGASWESRNNRVVWTVGQITGPLIGPNRMAACWPDLVLMEGPSYGSQHGAQFDRAGVWHGVYAAFRHKGIRIAVVPPRTRAKWATGRDLEGNGNATKREVYNAVCAEWKPLGANLSDFTKGGTDEADALVMAAMGALWLGDQLPTPTPTWRVNGLDAVAWPVIA